MRKASRFALLPLDTPQGRAVLARLSLTPEEEREAALREVSRQNIHLATWFLYSDAGARAAHGEWLAGEILIQLRWGVTDFDRRTLLSSLESLGGSAVAACRTLLDERQQSLPSHLAAIEFLARHGSSADVPRLERIAADPYLGQWEIESGRQLLREAQASILDEEAQKRYSRQEAVEMAKDTAVLIMKLVGTVANAAYEATEWNRDAAINFAGGILDKSGDQLATIAPSEFYQTQRLLRAIVAHFPAELERRKVDIHALAPRVREAAHGGAEALLRR